MTDTKYPEWFVSELKAKAHEYSLKFRSRKLKTPEPRLALAYEAGANATYDMLNEKSSFAIVEAVYKRDKVLIPEINKRDQAIKLMREGLEYIEEQNSYIDDMGNHVARQTLTKVQSILGGE